MLPTSPGTTSAPPGETDLALARLYLRNRRTEDAIEILERVVSLRQQALDEKDHGRRMSEHELAKAYIQDNRAKEAIPILEHVVAVDKRTLTEDDPNRLKSEHELARAFLDEKRVKNAIEILQRITAIERRAHVADTASGLASRHTLARAYLDDNRIRDATRILKHIVEVKGRTLPEDDASRLASQHELARAYVRSLRINEAIRILEHIVEVESKTLAADDESRLASKHELARTYLRKLRVKDAIEIFKNIVEIESETLKENDESRLASEHELARAYLQDNNAAEAIPLLEHVVSVEEKVLAIDDSVRLVSIDLLWSAYKRAKKLPLLHNSARKGQLQVTKLLLELGADLSAPDTGRQTPLHLALEGGHIDIGTLLILRGANIAAADKDGRTPLHCAAERAAEQGGRANMMLLYAKVSDPKGEKSRATATGHTSGRPAQEIKSAVDGWDAVRQLAIYLPSMASPTADQRHASIAYSWEVPDILLKLYTTKAAPGGESPSGTMPLWDPMPPWDPTPPWDPMRMYEEIAKTAINTGSQGSYEFGLCSELLEILWPGVGLDALRYVAAAAFLRHFSEFRAESRSPDDDLSVETEKDAYALLGADDSASDSSDAIGWRHLQDWVLHKLFGHPHEAQSRPTFLPRTVSRNIFVINMPSGYDKGLSEAIAWICAALRSNPDPEKTSSPGSIRLSRGAFHHLGGFPVWNMCPLEEMLGGSDVGSSCWKHLFSPGLVVESTIKRPWGRGLGMSFSMMATLAAAESFVRIDGLSEPDEKSTESLGGYVLAGFRTALVPTGISEDGKAIQWHLETSADEMIDPWDLEGTKEQWLRTDDLSLLQGAKCFLGWYKNAYILLGTNQLTEMPRWSGSRRQKHRSLHLAAVSLGAAIGPSSPLQGGPAANMTFNYVNNVQTFEPSREYARALDYERRKTALVVDYSEKRGYLVPKLSFLLHLCRIEACRAQDHNVLPHSSVPPAIPSTDGSRAAFEVFRVHGEKTVIGMDNDQDRTTLRQLFLQISFDLARSAQFREAPRRGTLLQHTKIYPTELLGLLERPDNGIPLSEVSDPLLDDSWACLAKLADAVCVCNNLGTVIRPVAEDSVGLAADPSECECHELPGQRYLLAAHMWCLARILERMDRNIDGLRSEGELDFGGGYKMRLGCSGKVLWTTCRGHNGGGFWEIKPQLIQSISKEGKLKAALRNGNMSEAPHLDEAPPLTAVLVFGGWA